MTSSRTPEPAFRQRLVARSAMILGLLALCGCASLTALNPAAPLPAGTGPEQKEAPQAADTPRQDQPAPQSAEAGDSEHEATPASPSYRPANLPQLALTPPLVYEILAAEVALQRRQPKLAYSTYHTLAVQIRDARLARRATEAALHSRALDDALPTARLWLELDPDSAEARHTLDALLLATGRIDEVEPVLARQLATARQKNTLAATYRQLQQQLLNARHHDKGWQVIQRLSQADLDNPAARLARAHLAAAAGQRQAAADEAQAALALAPADPNALLASAQYLQPLENGTAQAIALLQQHLDRLPENPQVRVALARLQIATGQREAAISTLEQMPAAEQDTPLVLYTLAQLHFQQQALARASHYLERYVGLPAAIPRDNAPAYLFLAEIAEQDHNLPAAIDWLGRIRSEQSPLYLEALGRRAILTARQSRPETGLALLGTARPRDRKQEQLLLVSRAQILREADRNQEAFVLLDKAVKAPGDSTDLLYDHALAAEKIQRLDILEKSLRTLIKRRPDSGHAYNALGYTLADHNIRLPEALQLIRKAERLMPDNPHVLDSLGWVYYRMNRHAEALAALEKAYARQPDVEIAAHYGEVLWVQGQQDHALKVWREAQRRDPGNPLLHSTLKRLGVSL